MNGWIVRWMDVCMVGWMDEWMFEQYEQCYKRLHEGELNAVARGADDGPYTLSVGWVGVRIVGTVEGPGLHVQVPTTA